MSCALSQESLHESGLEVGAGVAPKQQSATNPQLLPGDEKSAAQLSVPHFRLPAQSESESQSPPPMLHGFLRVQQLQSVLGTPLHTPGVMVVGAWVGACVVGAWVGA